MTCQTILECWLEVGEEWGIELPSELKQRVMEEATRPKRIIRCKSCGQTMQDGNNKSNLDSPTSK